MSIVITVTVILLVLVVLFIHAYIINKETNKEKNNATEKMHNQSQCVKCKKMFEQSPEYRDSTKCFDCLNDSKSQQHLNVSYGNANLYSTP
jgi:hypothetical protein